MASTITDGIRPISGVEFPERRKLKFFDKVPQLPAQLKPPKMMKDLYDMRGPELIHNKLQYGEFGIQVCITTTASLSLYHYHCIIITVTASLSLYCYHCITIPALLSLLSLSLHHYPCVIIPASLSLYHYHCHLPTTTGCSTGSLEFSLYHCHCITVSLSPTMTGCSMGSLEFSLYHCHCITVSLSPTMTGCSMGSLVFRPVSLSLHHYQSVTRHDRLQ